jgi:solute carrier family 35 protein C2
MTKSSSLIFILIFGIIFGVEKCSASITAIILSICCGVFLSSYGEAEFSAVGFALIILSEIFVAVRWVVTEKALKKSGLDSCDTIFYMSPGATLSLIGPVVAIEKSAVYDSFVGEESVSLSEYSRLVLSTGVLAFMLLLVEVQLVAITSSLTLSVFGNLKSIVTILFSIIVFGEKTSRLQWCGLLVALTGIASYSVLKNRMLGGRQETGIPSKPELETALNGEGKVLPMIELRSKGSSGEVVQQSR